MVTIFFGKGPTAGLVGASWRMRSSSWARMMVTEGAKFSVVWWARRSGLVTHGPPVHAVLRAEGRDCVSNVGPGGQVVARLIGMLLFQQNGAHDNYSCGDVDRCTMGSS